MRIYAGIALLVCAFVFSGPKVNRAAKCGLHDAAPPAPEDRVRHASPPPDATPLVAPARNLVPSAYAGRDAVALVGEEVEFSGAGSSAELEIVSYAWDFDGDGRDDFVSDRSGYATHAFASAGSYRCVLTVTDSEGESARDSRLVVVVASKAEAQRAREALVPSRYTVYNEPDGVTHRYAVMINGGGEERFWTDVELGYDMLVNRYGFSPDDVYLLNYDGTDPDGENPGGMIDYPARFEYVDSVFARLADLTDADDEVFIWITDHGRGYSGPTSEGGRHYGYLDGRASIDPGDEQDYPESEFKLRSLATCGDYMTVCNHGLNVWIPYRSYYSTNVYRFYRSRFVSHFEDVYIESIGTTVSDGDIYIEELRDYALGDTNRDGMIDTNIGEVYDYDGDGDPPYDPGDGTFDEDDWGEVDLLTDDYNNCNTGMPEGGWPYKIFDEGFQGKLCIDLGYTGGIPVVDGRDEDNAGLFDWLDANQDGDTDDTISVDEAVCLLDDPLYDDDLAIFIDRLTVAKVTTVAMPCFSGGLIEDLAAPNRGISTATTEENVSYGDGFIRDFTAALHGIDENGAPVDADADENGYVSMVEAFNYAAQRNFYSQTPQYEDNGDGVPQEAPVPAGGDGAFGAATYLCDYGAETVATPAFSPGGGTYDLMKLVSISCATPGAVIRYTMDDSDPGPASPAYSELLTVDHRLVLKARAYKSGCLTSHTGKAVYLMPGENIVHVTPEGDDGNDGSSWAAAKRTITSALGAASAGDDVWIKGDSGAVYTERISVPTGVAVYGGFDGDETARGQRRPFPRMGGDSCVTVIDGGGTGTVVTFPSGAGSTTLIDGCTIRNGYQSLGGGIYVGSGTPAILRCTIEDNYVTSGGGGIYCASYASPLIDRCIITGNVSENSGGGLYAGNGCGPSIRSSIIAGNSAGIWAGGTQFDSYSANATPEIMNSLIVGNSAGQDGGGVLCRDYSALTMVNCTVSGNSSSYSGGGLHCSGCKARMVNCIVWGNSTAYYGDNIKLRQAAELDVAYSAVEQAYPSVHVDADCVLNWGDGCVDGDPLLADPDGPDDDPGTWLDNDYSLETGSPCIDASDDDELPQAITLDITGHVRRTDCIYADPDPGRGTPPIVDMGACEWQFPTGVDDGVPPRLATSLRQNYPNPFNPVTSVSFSLRGRGRVVIRIYDVSGRLVRTLVDAICERGFHTIVWNGVNDEGRAAASGVYFCRMEAGGARQTRKMVLIR